MTRRTFKAQPTDNPNMLTQTGLPTNQPVAVYYRQSTEAQVGNVSTIIQTVDMVAELERRGWKREDIILIDTDEGISGTKRIDERQGMSQLFELITDGKIGTVACQDEDRLFRDVTQIQVNIFIEACRKSKVNVLTPFFTYDFSHPLHGDFHARQFRFKSEMAAEYIKSYVVGRLAPARQRIIREGRWAGAPIAVGYMIDMRKQLPDGTENPNWRKLVPFEPYAEIVRAYFRIFVENCGAIRPTMHQLRREGLAFPNCKPPDGFKINYMLKERSGGYFLSRTNFVRLLTNPTYLGHWSYQAAVIRWDNHPAIIDPDLFTKAFNFLSRYTLTGQENPHFQPAYQYVRPELDFVRLAERPVLTGLIYTQINGSWRRAGQIFEKRNDCYLYVQNRSEPEGIVTIWARRSAWIDEAVINVFKHKLIATFNADTWQQSMQDDEQGIERDRKVRRQQLSLLNTEMQNLIESLKTLSHPYLVQEVEKRFAQMEHERVRLETELANIQLRRRKYVTIEQAYEIFKRAVAEWGKMTVDERRNILALFIERIEVSDFDRSGKMRLVIKWQDGSSDDIQLWHKPHSSRWSIEKTEQLLELVDKGASQLDIAATFPNLKWWQIYIEIKKHRGITRFSPSYLGKEETYSDYIARGGGKGKATGSFWRPDELDILQDMVLNRASQIEIMQRFPFRRWIQLQERIKKIFGTGTRVPYSGISQRLTYTEYIQSSVTADEVVNEQSAAEHKTLNAEYGSER